MGAKAEDAATAAGSDAGGALGGAALGTAIAGPVGTVVGRYLGSALGSAAGGKLGGKAAGALGDKASGDKPPTATPVKPPPGGLDKALGGADKAFKAMDKGLGVVTKPLESVNKVLDATAKPLEIVDKHFKKVTDTVSKAGNIAADYATKPLQMLTQSMNAVNGPALKVIGTLGAFRDAVTAVGNAMAQFVQLANPAIVQRFRFAADDLTASIGRGLIPAMNFATKITRAFGDVVFTLSGPFQRLSNSVFKPLGEAADAVLAALSPVVRMFGRLTDLAGAILRPFGAMASALFKIVSFGAEGAFAGLEASITPIIEGLTAVAIILGRGAEAFNRMVDGAIKRIRSFLGISPSIAGASTGAAVRNVGLSSVESYQNKAMTTAFSLGTASAEERTAKGVEDMVKALDNLPKNIWEYVKALPEEIAVALARLLPGGGSENPGSIMGSIMGSIPGAPSAPSLSTIGRDSGRWLDRQVRRLNPYSDDDEDE